MQSFRAAAGLSAAFLVILFGKCVFAGDWLTTVSHEEPVVGVIQADLQPGVSEPVVQPVRPVQLLRPPVEVDDHDLVIYPTTVAEPTYRSPYPYGYFGARNHKMLYRQQGYRRSFTEWRFR